MNPLLHGGARRKRSFYLFICYKYNGKSISNYKKTGNTSTPISVTNGKKLHSL